MLCKEIFGHIKVNDNRLLTNKNLASIHELKSNFYNKLLENKFKTRSEIIVECREISKIIESTESNLHNQYETYRMARELNTILYYLSEIENDVLASSTFAQKSKSSGNLKSYYNSLLASRDLTNINVGVGKELGEIVSFRPNAAKLFGYSKAEFYGIRNIH